MSDRASDVIIVGGGIGGAAAALRAGQYGLKVTWVLGDSASARASRGKYVHEVDNMIGLHPGVMLGKLRKLLKDDEEALRKLDAATFTIGTQDIIDNVVERLAEQYPESAVLLRETAVKARRTDGGFEVELAGGDRLSAPACVLSTGVMDVQPPIKKSLPSGKERDDIAWVFPYANFGRLLYCIRCEGHMVRETPTAVIGASETTAQIAMMLHERYGVEVTILTNGDELEVSPESRRLLEAYGIGSRKERIVDFEDLPPGEQPEQRVKRGTELHAVVLEGGVRVPARFAMIAMGLHRVYNDLARELGAELEGGELPVERQHVLVEDRSSETSVSQLFCVGDMARRRDGGPLMKQIYTAQEFAVRAVDTIERRRRSARRSELLR